MKLTIKSIEQDITRHERDLHFLRQLLTYLKQKNGPTIELTAAPVGTETLPTATLQKEGVTNVGMRASILRRLVEGAAFPEDLLQTWTGNRRSALNALAMLRRNALIRDTAKGRIELTTAGLEEAGWYVTHPEARKRPPSTKGKGK